MSAHTPGPWAQYEGDPLIIIDSTGASLGEISAGSPNVSRSEQIANARLAAAAPDGLALARYAVDNPNFDSSTFDRMAREFIAKATGEQP